MEYVFWTTLFRPLTDTARTRYRHLYVTIKIFCDWHEIVGICAIDYAKNGQFSEIGSCTSGRGLVEQKSGATLGALTGKPYYLECPF